MDATFYHNYLIIKICGVALIYSIFALFHLIFPMSQRVKVPASNSSPRNEYIAYLQADDGEIYNMARLVWRKSRAKEYEDTEIPNRTNYDDCMVNPYGFVPLDMLRSQEELSLINEDLFDIDCNFNDMWLE